MPVHLPRGRSPARRTCSCRGWLPARGGTPVAIPWRTPGSAPRSSRGAGTPPERSALLPVWAAAVRGSTQSLERHPPARPGDRNGPRTPRIPARHDPHQTRAFGASKPNGRPAVAPTDALGPIRELEPECVRLGHRTRHPFQQPLLVKHPDLDGLAPVEASPGPLDGNRTSALSTHRHLHRDQIVGSVAGTRTKPGVDGHRSSRQQETMALSRTCKPRIGRRGPAGAIPGTVACGQQELASPLRTDDGRQTMPRGGDRCAPPAERDHRPLPARLVAGSPPAPHRESGDSRGVLRPAPSRRIDGSRDPAPVRCGPARHGLRTARRTRESRDNERRGTAVIDVLEDRLFATSGHSYRSLPVSSTHESRYPWPSHATLAPPGQYSLAFHIPSSQTKRVRPSSSTAKSVHVLHTHVLTIVVHSSQSSQSSYSRPEKTSSFSSRRSPQATATQRSAPLAPNLSPTRSGQVMDPP